VAKPEQQAPFFRKPSSWAEPYLDLAQAVRTSPAFTKKGGVIAPLVTGDRATLEDLTYPLFFMVKLGDFDSALAADVVLSALLACSGGPIAAAVAEVAPAKARSTILVMSFAFSITILGGFAPLIATYLISTADSPLAPAFYAMAASVVSS